MLRLLLLCGVQCSLIHSPLPLHPPPSPPQPPEKVAIGLMCDRESKREENLEKRAAALARAARAAAAGGEEGDKDDDAGMEEVLRKVRPSDDGEGRGCCGHLGAAASASFVPSRLTTPSSSPAPTPIPLPPLLLLPPPPGGHGVHVFDQGGGGG